MDDQSCWFQGPARFLRCGVMNWLARRADGRANAVETLTGCSLALLSGVFHEPGPGVPAGPARQGRSKQKSNISVCMRMVPRRGTRDHVIAACRDVLLVCMTEKCRSHGDQACRLQATVETEATWAGRQWWLSDWSPVTPERVVRRPSRKQGAAALEPAGCHRSCHIFRCLSVGIAMRPLQ
ncbi:hypothetical protein HPP92_004720 [Vanilla planifolia]|uniref:Uncharacterized protein n=1 Tax=Vanilla planifolia TaxID=51239 RepID=A0A835VCA4_VANPL|nr:hypothetical protein HPP92_005078 [Vanilla planifolia]KAG0493726.1 hypothetical protein HPP92_004720 [Vanilla planifolia]